MTSAPSTGDRLKLVVAYDGSDFHGFASQGFGVRTVESRLTEVLETVLQAPRDTFGFTCAGRTDSGVHAWGQVVSIDAPAGTDTEKIRKALNGWLAPEIVVRQCTKVDREFDARRSAKWRRYRYMIVNRPEPDPFVARYSWWMPQPLDIAQLRLAADPFVGEHDFASFCRKGAPGSTTTRRVLESQWIDEGDGVLTYDIRGTAFCWQMVRSIVGTMVDAALGKFRPGDIMGIIRAGDRQSAGRVAPPHGLCLWSVGYD